jgi:hypothetical protein
MRTVEESIFGPKERKAKYSETALGK